MQKNFMFICQVVVKWSSSGQELICGEEVVVKWWSSGRQVVVRATTSPRTIKDKNDYILYIKHLKIIT